MTLTGKIISLTAIFAAGYLIGHMTTRDIVSPAERSRYPAEWKVPMAGQYPSTGRPTTETLSDLVTPRGLNWRLTSTQITMIVFFLWVLTLTCIIKRMCSWKAAERRERKAIYSASTADNPVTGVNNGIGDSYLARQADQASNQAVINPPRTLLQNPFGAEHQGLTFEDRVQIAAEASLRHDRVIGAIRFKLGAMTCHSQEAPHPAALSVESLADCFHDRLRATDCIRILGEDDIAVFISLLHTKDDLNRIAARLFAEASALAEQNGLQLTSLPGTAIYPLDGYSGDALMEAAYERIRPLSHGITLQSARHPAMATDLRNRVPPHARTTALHTKVDTVQ
ncbi:MAG: hypothetical protein KDJ29_10180 [Hyphomicrobiales bacterium]|nr:hypothetical protein [Hyphomicrobiales bacterium]